MADIARHVRAARAYAGLSQEDLAHRLEQDVQTVKRTEAGTRTPKGPELRAIAEECAVPREFLTEGFDCLPAESAAELSDLDAQMKDIREYFDQLQARRHQEVVAPLAFIREVVKDHLLPYLAERESTPADDPQGTAGEGTAPASSRTNEASAAKGSRGSARRPRGAS